MKVYFKNIGTSLSQVLHAILGGNPKVTLSARLGSKVLAGKKWAIFACKIISAVFFDKNHCVRAFKKDQEYSNCAHSDLKLTTHG